MSKLKKEQVPPAGEQNYNSKLKSRKANVRYLNEMKNVLYDQEWAKSSPNLELYYMYRNMAEKDGLRYDITVIPPQLLGKEFVKTKGHEHCTQLGEVYIVLEGEAIYLLQKREGEEIKDVFAIKTKAGEVAIIPPQYGHVTINPANNILKMANWVAKDCKNDFSFFEEKQGACYYYILQPGSGQAEWVKNSNYKNVPKLRFEKPLKELPQNLSFLSGN